MYFSRYISRKLSCLTNSHVSPTLVNSKIKAFVQQGLYIEALQSYCSSPLDTTKFTFPSLVKACASLPNLHYGKNVHATIITMGLHSDSYIATSLIHLYVKCGSLADALQVFDTLPEREVLTQDVTIWNTMIDGYFRFGYIEEGLVQFGRMLSLGMRPDAYSLCILLGASNGFLVYKEGKKIHGYIVRNIFKSDAFLETALIYMYFNCARPADAWRAFTILQDKNNIVLWNVVIGGFCENGLFCHSLELYSLAKIEGVRFVSTSFSSILSACYVGKDVVFGRQVHCDVIKMGFESDPYVCTSLLTTYGQCEFIEDAKKVFHQDLDKKIESWNAMISANVGNCCPLDALKLYNEMKSIGLQPDTFTILNILSSTVMKGSYYFGRLVHAEMSKRPLQGNMAVQSALLTMYSKCESINDAISIFNMMKERDVIAWGSMISGFCQSCKFQEALDCFKAMEVEGVKPDSDIMASIINACAGLEDVKLGCGIHAFVTKSGLELDIFVASSLVDMYSKCGFPELAGHLFSAMPHKNLVAWNSMILCYSRNGLPEFAIDLFPQIVQNGLYPDAVSFTSALVAVASIAALLKGRAMHAYLIRLNIPSDFQVESALIDMYIKCGCLTYAQNVFRNMSRRNLVTWNSMIAGYGYHGECIIAIRLFEEMKDSGLDPDDVTFLSLLSSCNHAGLIEEGLSLFESMRGNYGIEPRMEHYVNIIDLLGRAGWLNEAYNLVKSMPIEPDRSIWLCLLSACRAHHNVKLGEVAANNLLKMEPSSGSNYIQMLNLYGETELRDKSANLRVAMKEKGLKKSPGCSWIEHGNRVDVFFSGDSSSPRTGEIYETLNGLRKNMDRKGDRSTECADDLWDTIIRI
ncbi:pentatricopeptide repeat-containing protein [Tripterygium wilfordii]|uniref:Pentatricopeptide repeat-containing protein n=1 Tax=Tripterygium wilfordii TaxID=458696 RepID=A0A7J7CR16_TRIWF|nr:pentatricopeptide repeat-containing protein At2g40720 [Tripterygium wilfordii]KAF5736501.1 pentatricopeptide repeat-containing protein [Tripterygium wilfordii]